MTLFLRSRLCRYFEISLRAVITRRYCGGKGCATLLDALLSLTSICHLWILVYFYNAVFFRRSDSRHLRHGSATLAYHRQI